MRTDQAYPFFLFRTEDNALIGGLALANIRRGVAQAGSLGYWIGAPYSRRGYMTAAVRALVPAAFDMLRLHRRGGGLHPDQSRLGAAPGEDRLPARGLCPLLPVHQRDMAGPPALRAAAKRPKKLR